MGVVSLVWVRQIRVQIIPVHQLASLHARAASASLLELRRNVDPFQRGLKGRIGSSPQPLGFAVY